MSFELKVFKEKECLPYVDLVVEMRLNAFSAFPYLYVATFEEERSYVSELSSTPQGLLVVVFNEDQVIGFFSGIPLNLPNSHLEPYVKKLQEKGVDTNTTYYGGEIIVIPEFQKGRCCALLIKRFLQEVKSMGFRQLLFVTCIREENHPLCPKNYTSPESVWLKSGAQKTDIVLSIPWRTHQAKRAPKRQMNSLACWIKPLSF